MEANKIIGYVLLFLGVLLIVMPLWQTYTIFTGASEAPKAFSMPVSVLKTNPNVGVLDIQGQVQNALIKIIPVDFIDNTINLSAWLLLMWILMYGGGKIADIGVKLIK